MCIILSTVSNACKITKFPLPLAFLLRPCPHKAGEIWKRNNHQLLRKNRAGKSLDYHFVIVSEKLPRGMENKICIIICIVLYYLYSYSLIKNDLNWKFSFIRTFVRNSSTLARVKKVRTFQVDVLLQWITSIQQRAMGKMFSLTRIRWIEVFKIRTMSFVLL